MRPLFADAFFFLALLIKTDRAHAAAALYLNPRLNRPLLTPAWVLTEVRMASPGPTNAAPSRG